MPLDNTNELFYLVDDQDNVLGSVKRGEANSNPGFIHRAVQIVIINSANQTLLQQRSIQKDTYPGYWTVSASGHVDYGEDYETTAYRELSEEIGLRGVELEFKTKVLVRMPHESEFEAIYIGHSDVTPQELDPQEVSQVSWVDLDKLQEFVSSQKVTHPALSTYKALGYIK